MSISLEPITLDSYKAMRRMVDEAAVTASYLGERMPLIELMVLRSRSRATLAKFMKMLYTDISPAVMPLMASVRMDTTKAEGDARVALFSESTELLSRTLYRLQKQLKGRPRSQLRKEELEVSSMIDQAIIDLDMLVRKLDLARGLAIQK